MTAQQLKNSILQMAVQGKLVPQDPNDEPASVLLERIREEKKRLIKEGKIKKEKNPSVIFRGDDNLPYEKVGDAEPVCIADEVPFEIPESWEWARCSSIGTMIRGKGIKRSETVPKGLPCIRYGEIYTSFDTSFTDTVSYVPSEVDEKCNHFQFGDVVFTLTGENKPDIAKAVAYLGDKSVAAGGDLAYWTAHGMNPLFLSYYLNCPYCIEQKKRLATGDIIVHISTGKVGSFLLPIPPIKEQQRIVDCIESITDLISEYAEKSKISDDLSEKFPEQLKKSILQQAVMGKLVPQDEADESASVLIDRIRAEKAELFKAGKIKKDKHESVIYRRDNSHYEKVDGEERCIDDEIPFDIPESWQWMRLSSFGQFSSGKTPSMADPKNWGGDVNWISSKDMKRQVLMDSELHITKYAADSMRIYPKGTLLLVARSGILKRLLPLCVLGVNSTINQDIKAFSLYYPDLSEWLFYSIKAFEPMILKELVKSVTTVESLKFDEFSAMLIPVPPFNEQLRIIKTIREYLKIIKPLYSDPMLSA